MDGYQLARALRSNPRTELIPVIFLTAKGERKDRLAGIRTGADAYLTKPFDPEELLAVVSNLLKRAERTSAELARLVGSAGGAESPSSQAAPDEDFTEAEGRVARLVAEGLSNKEIAAELGVSARTVEGHVSNILSKKGWSNRVEIARHVFGRGAWGKPTAHYGAALPRLGRFFTHRLPRFSANTFNDSAPAAPFGFRLPDLVPKQGT
jgi:DNA-binding NarL/FixJ family response regulator